MRLCGGVSCLITGGAGGIGLACAQLFLSRGCSVYLIDRNQVKGEQTANELQSQYGKNRVTFQAIDVTNAQQLDQAFAQATQTYGKIDVVINNAGIGDRTAITSPEAHGRDFPSDWSSTINVNLVAVINGTRLAVREMMKSKQSSSGSNSISTSSSSGSGSGSSASGSGSGSVSGSVSAPSSSSSSISISNSNSRDVGVIINVASLGGLYGMPPTPIYCATKHAVVGYSRSLRPLSSKGIRVNCLCPGFTDTDMVSDGMKSSAKFNQTVSNSGPLMTPGEIAEACAILIEREDLAGEVLSVTRQMGAVLHHPPEFSNKSKQITVLKAKL